MKKLFWGAASIGFGAYGLALGIYWAIRLEGSGALGDIIVFFVPLMMFGLSAAVITNLLYFKRKDEFTQREKIGALSLAVLSVLMIVLI